VAASVTMFFIDAKDRLWPQVLYRSTDIPITLTVYPEDPLTPVLPLNVAHFGRDVGG